jgi:ectoine hydroxylase-related dioxygenase (phytanoyl-CoA dioxygenase family)
MKLTPAQQEFWEQNGYLVVPNIISPEEIAIYQSIYNQFLDGTIQTGTNRSDLGAGLGKDNNKENITQIMWPSDFIPDILTMPYHQKALSIAQALMGEDIQMDFDMLINKAPFTDTPTPWHQDAAYWIDMPDKRAASCWLALDEATVENGCMWYIPASHLKPIRPHRFAGKQGGALTCDASETEGAAVELLAGSCVFHHGMTLHYSRGNTTKSQRRAFIVNFRPDAMIELERQKGFDHGRSGGAADRKVRSDEFK